MIEKILWQVAAGLLTVEQARRKLAAVYAKCDAARKGNQK